MSMGYRGKTTNRDQEVGSVRNQNEHESKFGEIPGKVVDFDPVKQTATIQPLYRPIHNGQPVDMPELQEVPVRFARAGHGATTYPIQKGDILSLRPQMRSTENYHTEGKYEPSDKRSMALSDMEAYPAGGESLMDPIKNFDDKNVHHRFDPEGKYGIRGSEDGKIKIEGKEGNIYDLVATVVELLAADTLIIKHGSSSGNNHQLEFKDQYAEIAGKLRAMALD